jgi:DNA-binding CsgD family transcriptional regulator/tetratricopeptide (TPR) repeat protein
MAYTMCSTPAHRPAKLLGNLRQARTGMTLRNYRTSFVGRAGELARLEQALAAASEGLPIVVLVGGEAGVGKTRLVDEFAGRATAVGVRVLAGGCVKMTDGGLPYGPVVEALREFRRESGATLREVLGPDQAEFAWSPPGSAEGPHGPLPLFEWLLWLLRRLSEDEAVLLIVEDLHWADQSTLDLLRFVLHNMRRERFMVLLTYRDDERLDRPVRAFLADLGRDSRAERIDLPRFQRDELALLLTGVLDRSPEEALVERVYQRSEGNAFFAEELVAVGRSQPGRPVPDRLRDVLLTRVEALSDDAQETLRVIAECGRHVDHCLLATVSNLGGRQLGRVLREVCDHQIVVTDEAGHYMFRHALTHEAVYHSLLPGERRSLHSRIAQALESGACFPADEPAVLVDIARHWHEARDYPRALVATIASARSASASMLSVGDADRQYQRALDLWERVAERPAEPDLPDLLKEAAEAARWVGDPSRAIGLIERALYIVDAAAEPTRAGLLHERLGLYLWEAGDGKRSMAAYETASKLLGSEAISPARAWMLADRCALLMLSSRYREARLRCEEALLVAREAGARRAEIHLLNTLGYCMVMLDEADEGIARLRDSLAMAERDHDVEAVCRAYTNLVTVLPLAGRYDEALALAEEGIALTRERGVELTAGGVLLGITAAALFRLGDWTRAESLTREMLDRSVPEGLALFARVTRVELDTGRGRLDDAQRSLELLDACARRTTDPMALAHVQAATAELAIWKADHAAARAAVARGLDLLKGTEENHLALRLCAIGLRAEADEAERAVARKDAGRAADTRRAGEALLNRARAAAAGPGAGFPEAHAHALTCEAEATRLGSPADHGAWAAAAQAWERLRFPATAGYARFREAEAALAGKAYRTAPPEAVEALRAARQHMAALRDEPAGLLGEIELLARHGRIDLATPGRAGTASPGPRAAEPSPAEQIGLTPRERDVLPLIVEGYSNRRIAETLFITEKTASVHVSNIIAKLGVKTRGQAAAAAYKLGLVDAPLPAGAQSGSASLPNP